MRFHRTAPRIAVAIAAPFITAVLLASTSKAQLRDGKQFDQGRQMTERTPSAPEQLDHMAPYIGHWDVGYEV